MATRLSFPSRPCLRTDVRGFGSVLKPDAARGPVDAMVITTRVGLQMAEAEARAAQRMIADLESVAPPGLAAQLSGIAAAMRESGTDLQAPPKYTVALMGRTQAGKSTLMAALTGASEDAIGWPGRQRHTRTVTAKEMLDLPGVELVDTPGVGALDGPEDRAIALAQLDRAQVVVWVAPNDGFQEDTAESLRLVAGLGKPVIVVLNSKADLRHDINLEEFLLDPERMLAASEGHLEAIRRHLREVGAEPLAEIVLHAQAAFFGLRESRHAPELDAAARMALTDASAIRSLIGVLEREARSQPRKILAVAHQGRLALSTANGALRAGSSNLGAIADITAEKGAEVRKRQARVVDAAEARLLAAVRASVSERRAWGEEFTLHQLRKESSAIWQDQQRRLDEAVAGAFDLELGRLQEELDSVLRDVDAEFEHLPITSIDSPDVREKWLKRIVQLSAKAAISASGAKAGGALGALLGGLAGTVTLPGVGTVAGAKIGATVGTFAGVLLAAPLSRLANRVGDIFRSETEILARYRQRIRPETDRVLDERQAAYEDRAHDLIAKVRGDLDRLHADNDERMRRLRACAAWLDASADRIEAATARFDADTAVHTLRSAARPIDRSDILDAWRCPGQGTVVRVREPAFSALALSPSATPEPIVPVSESTAAPAADVAQILIGVTASAFAVDEHEAGVLATIEGMVASRARREAWEEMAARITGSSVSIDVDEVSSAWIGRRQDRDDDEPVAA